MDRFTFQAALESIYQRVVSDREYQYTRVSYADLIEHISEIASPLLPEFGEVDKNDVKSVEAATTLRNVGNAAYTKDKNFPRALECYTKSVCAAPYPKSEADDSTALALAFANRSAVLFSMLKYDDCVRDVEQALKFGYPDNRKHRLYARRGDCLQIMGKMKEAKKSFEAAANALSLDVDLAETEKKKKLIQVQLQLDRIKKGYPRDEVYKPKQQRAPPVLVDGFNAQVPAASSCVEVAYTPEWGRHIRATRDIKPGEVILVEEPYVSTLRIEKFLLYCHNCLERCVSPIPCKTCRIVGFCSEKCREIGMKSVHDIECPILVQLVKQVEEKREAETCLLIALQILILASKRYCGLRGLVKQAKKMEKTSTDGKIKGFNEAGLYLSSDYITVHYLHTNREKQHMYILVELAVNALRVLKCIEKHGIFKNNLTDAPLKWFVGGLLLQYELASLGNRHPANSFEPDANMLDTFPCIGYLLHPTLSLMNHSCLANAYDLSYVKPLVIKSMLPISKGEQVFLDYIPSITGFLRPLAERQFALRTTFHLECKCILCTLKLPEEQLGDILLYWQCQQCCAKLPSVHVNSSAVMCHQCKRMNPVQLLRKEANKRVETYQTLTCQVIMSRGEMIPELAVILEKMSSKKETTPELWYSYRNLIKMSELLLVMARC